MAEKGINFRATAGYVTDPATDTYSLGEAYPTTRGGVTFGWATNKTAQSRDRSAGLVRLGGIVFHTNGASTTTFRVDLPSAGTYRIRLAAGDTAAAQAQRILIKDNTTTLATLAASTPANQWMDATGVVRTSYSDWTSNNASVDLTFSTTTLILECGDAGGSGSNATSLSHFQFESVGDSTPPTLTGSITVTGTTDTTISISHPAGSDNVAVTSYEYSTNGGTSYTDSASTATTRTFTGLTAGTSYALRVRAKDAAGNVSSALSLTQSTGPTLSSGAFSSVGTTTATISANTTGLSNGSVYFLRRSGGSAASAATIKATGESQTASASNPQSRAMTGFSAGSSDNYVDIVQAGTGGADSNVISVGPFSTASGGGATSVTFTGPTSGTVGVASTNFTVGANGTITGTVTVTPAATGGGSFSPTSVNISSGTPTATFTYTPASSGLKSLSVTNNGGLANEGPIAFTANAAGAGTITSEPLRRNNGTLAGAVSLNWISALNVSTGALVVTKTSVTANASSVFSINDAALVQGTTYRLVWEEAGGQAGTARATAV